MPEKRIYSLSEVIGYIKNVIDERLSGKRMWLKAELSNINFHRSGHCYIDLVETVKGQTLAQCRATIWAMQLREIRQELGDDFPNIVKKGAEILCTGEVVFHPVFGLSINIMAIDRSFSLGELERKKQESLAKLEAKGLLGKNKERPLPAVIQRIALVGSPGTSGHADFLKMLERNEHGFDFQVTDFPCQVQGDHAAGEIIGQLKALRGSGFDVVVLIRGGGSKLDLEVFNAFELAKTIALHDKPILTGIGHETDVSVADIVAHRQFKTPSAVGSFVVDRAYQFYVDVTSKYSFIREYYDRFMRNQRHRVEQGGQAFRSESISYTRLRRGELHTVANRINALATGLLAETGESLALHRENLAFHARRRTLEETKRWKNAWELAALHVRRSLAEESRETKHRTELLKTAAAQSLRREGEHLGRNAQLLQVYHPARTLERGWAIVRHEGKVVSPGTELLRGDALEIELHDRILLTTFIEESEKWKNSPTKALQKS